MTRVDVETARGTVVAEVYSAERIVVTWRDRHAGDCRAECRWLNHSLYETSGDIHLAFDSDDLAELYNAVRGALRG